jgi:acid phosphatase (class A)
VARTVTPATSHAPGRTLLALVLTSTLSACAGVPAGSTAETAAVPAPAPPAASPPTASSTPPPPSVAPHAAADAAAFPAYLPAGVGIESLSFLPPPPAAGSAAFAHDEDVARRMLERRGTARWNLATEDSNTAFPRVATTWSCALGMPVTPEDTPVLYRVLRRVVADSSRATRSGKDHHRRPRPYVVSGGPTCTPDDDERLRTDGSYPSGHATRGWLWALTVSAVAPERAAAVMTRGRAYGESRVVCNVHWRSDVVASRDLAAAVFVRLHESAEFRADVESARAEVARVRAAGRPPSRDCAAEAAALAEFPPLTW